MENIIRKATEKDICRIAEIEIFNYRINFYPIFGNDRFYFDELQVSSVINEYLSDKTFLQNTYVYDDGAVKGFLLIDGTEIKKLFVEPILQGRNIGARLLDYALENHNIKFLWALEKNTGAIKFYKRHGFALTDEKKLEEGTAEYLVKLSR